MHARKDIFARRHPNPCYLRAGAVLVTPMAKRRTPQQREPAVGRAEKSERPVVIGARVRELQEARGWTQMELAWRANLSLPKISRVILEQQGLGAAGLFRLAVALNTSTDYLVGLTDDPKARR